MLAVVAAYDLLNTQQEVINTRTHAPAGCITEPGYKSTPALVKTVVSHLSSSSIVHFSCHGVQDRINLLDSGLVMSDGKLTIVKIME